MRTLAKLTWVEMKLFVREPITVVFTLALPVMILYVLTEVFGTTPDTGENGGIAVFRGVSPTDYYVPAYIGLVLSSIGVISMPVHLAGYREQGVIRRFRASSIAMWSVFGAQIAVNFVIAVLGAILLTVLAILTKDAALPKNFG